MEEHPYHHDYTEFRLCFAERHEIEGMNWINYQSTLCENKGKQSVLKAFTIQWCIFPYE